LARPSRCSRATQHAIALEWLATGKSGPSVRQHVVAKEQFDDDGTAEAAGGTTEKGPRARGDFLDFDDQHGTRGTTEKGPRARGNFIDFDDAAEGERAAAAPEDFELEPAPTTPGGGEEPGGEPGGGEEIFTPCSPTDIVGDPNDIAEVADAEMDVVEQESVQKSTIGAVAAAEGADTRDNAGGALEAPIAMPRSGMKGTSRIPAPKPLAADKESMQVNVAEDSNESDNPRARSGHDHAEGTGEHVVSEIYSPPRLVPVFPLATVNKKIWCVWSSFLSLTLGPSDAGILVLSGCSSLTRPAGRHA